MSRIRTVEREAEEEQNGLVMSQNGRDERKRQGRQQEKEIPMVLDRSEVHKKENRRAIAGGTEPIYTLSKKRNATITATG